MRAVLVSDDPAAGPRLAEIPDPAPGPGEVLLRIRASALNRADLLQIRGLYPPPPGESAVPGLEAAGEIVEVGEGVETWQPGARVMALLAGGGHGELAVVPAGQLMPIPDGWSFTDAAALPEVAITAWTNLVAEGNLAEGEKLLITAAASGVGTFAVQLARQLGAQVTVAGRSLERLERLRELGAESCLELSALPEAARNATDGHGFDLVLELAGGQGVAGRLASLAPRGRLVLVGILAGPRTEVDLADVLRRRLRLIGSVLRARPRDEKARLVADFHRFAAKRLADGRLRPVIDRVRPFEDVLDAYRELAEGSILGKIVLSFEPE